jgi:electron transfer flavoprotein alpha subunit
MRKILIVVERARGALDETAFEMLSAARGLGEITVAAVLMGEDLGEPAAELARWFDEVHTFDDPRLGQPDGDFQARLLAPFVRREQPLVTLVPHTNTGMELAPMLAARVDAPLIADAVTLEVAGDGVRAVRTVLAGKVQASVSATGGPCGVLLTVRPGAFTLPDVPPEAAGTVHAEAIPDDPAPRRRFVETVAPDPGAVDISQAEVLVAVGRGIEDEENLDEVRSLAEAMGAELACTRPVVDKKWLEKSRQVGTSGVTVKPRVYLALGISGSFQHMGGIKGGPFIAAINKDPAAPIFDVADVGVVGDILDLVPLLEKKIRGRKA